MTMGERIKELRIKMNITQEELGKVIDVKRSAIRKYEYGEVENIPRSSIQKMADYFNVQPAYLMGWIDEKNSDFDDSIFYKIETKKIPLLGDIACGQPLIINEEFESYVECGTEIQADFALHCQGDSMINARIQDGDIVFIRKQDMVRNGEIAAVRIEDEITLKRVYYYPDQQKIILNPENSKYEPLVYMGEELDHIQIIGKAVAFQSDVR